MKATSKQTIKDEAIDLLNSNTIEGKSIVVSNATAPNKEAISYLIQLDGIIEQCAPIAGNVHICLLGDININWSQKLAMVTLINELQSQGAGNIKRYDQIDSLKLNPVFDLNHTMIAYSLK